jgi:hypothetical protein
VRKRTAAHPTRREEKEHRMTENLASALAAFQAELPRVGTDNLGVIPGKDGKQGFKYKYANLAEVSHAALPLLARHGLSWSCKPTLLDGKLVLHYVLRHRSGEQDEGFWPLQGATPQQLGSSITYGRRYCLTAVTGIAPDDDDDGAAASHAPPARPVVEEPDPVELAAQARRRLAGTCKENEWDLALVADRVAAEHNGRPLRESNDAAVIERFRKSLFAVSDSELRASTNGVPA